LSDLDEEIPSSNNKH